MASGINLDLFYNENDDVALRRAYSKAKWSKMAADFGAELTSFVFMISRSILDLFHGKDDDFLKATNMVIFGHLVKAIQ